MQNSISSQSYASKVSGKRTQQKSSSKLTGNNTKFTTRATKFVCQERLACKGKTQLNKLSIVE